MTREQFTKFVAQALDDVIQLAEQKTGKELPRRLAFQWLGESPRVTENIADHIVQKVFVDEEHIYPCVDIGVGDLLEDGSLLIVGNVAGYSPRQFGKNWTGRDGPFVYVVGQPLLNTVAGRRSDWSPGGVFGFITPEIKSSPR
jgi:hypothetical protein